MMADAAVNGFTNGVNDVTVSVTNPAPGGDFNNRYDVHYVTIPFYGTVNIMLEGSDERTISR